MENLRECDLSENCLTDHNSLSPLLNLHSLLSLNLSGNPISFHAMHRSLTCGYLHENTVNEKVSTRFFIHMFVRDMCM